MREEYACTKFPPKSKRRIIGGPSDILFDRPKRSIKPSRSVKSPFLSKQHSFVRHDLKALDDLYTYVTSITDEEAVKKIWVHISQPVPMSLSLHDIQQAIRLDTQMQEETFNVAVQVLASYEIHRFGGTYFVGWRHFLNQDFAMFATASDDLWNPEDHLPSFKDDSLIPYDLPSCHLIFIPLLQPLHYSLYAFDMGKNNYASSTHWETPRKDRRILQKDTPKQRFTFQMLWRSAWILHFRIGTRIYQTGFLSSLRPYQL